VSILSAATVLSSLRRRATKRDASERMLQGTGGASPSTKSVPLQMFVDNGFHFC
jgi:hypothetical protein